MVDEDEDAAAKASPEDPTRLERHGTQLAGLLVGSEGPAKINGVARGATRASDSGRRLAAGGGRAAGRSSAAPTSSSPGLERAVDPNADGVVLDAARVALVGVAEPFAAFEDSPAARAVAGALRLDTLVVAPRATTASPAPGTEASPAREGRGLRSR